MSILDPMQHINDTQSLTKYLRSKDAPLVEIVGVAQQTLSDKSELFLPNGSLFVLELLADRLNDNNKFKNWKYYFGVWELFMVAVVKVTPQERDKVLRRIKFIEIFTKIFTEFYEVSNQPQFFTTLLKVAEFILQEVEIQADEVVCMAFVASFLNIFEMDLEDGMVIAWTHIGCKIFELSTNEIDYVPSKKNITRFYINCLPKILLCLQNLDSSLGECNRILTDLIISTIMRKDAHHFLLQNLQQMLKQDIPSGTVYLFFKILVENLGNKDVKLVEDVYLIIIDMVKYSEMSESLIEILATLNKPLTTDFFASVFDSTVKSSETNWKLIGYIINLDATLAMQKASVIIEMLNKQTDNVITLIMPDLITSYVRARDLFEFFTEVWLENINKNKIWASVTTVDVVAQNINDLSTANIKKVIEYVYEHDTSAYPLLLSIAKGLVTCPTEKVKDLEETIFKDSRYLSGFWELSFYLLISYPNQAEKFKVSTGEDNKYYFYSIFRIVELTANKELIDDALTNSYTTYIKTCDGETLSEVLLRWYVILGACFPQNAVEEVIACCLTKLDGVVVREILRDTDDLFEHKNVITALLKAALSTEKHFDLVPLIPIQSIDRSIKVELINKLTEHKCTDGLLHVLVQATSKSKIETDFEYLSKLVDSEPDFEEVFVLIWNNNIKQAKSDDHLDDVLKKLNKRVSKTKLLSEDLKVASLVLKETDSSVLTDKQQKHLKSLKSSYTKCLTSLLQNGSNTIEMFKSYLRLIDNVSIVIEHDIIKNVGQQLKSSNDKDANRLLFKVYLKSSEAKDYKHALSLYYILLEGTELDEPLQKYFLKISTTSEFNNLIVFVMQSLTADGDTLKVMKLLKFIIKTFSKDTGSEKILSIIVSIVLNNLDIVEKNLEALNVFLSTLKTALIESNWCFTQYSIEMIISLVSKVSMHLAISKESEAHLSDTYILATQILSQILLFHRFRLTSRHHIIMNVFVSLLNPLTMKSSLPVQVECSKAYSRLLSNLCEPSTTSKSLASNQLTTASTLIKKNLRKYLPNLLVNYITLALTKNFSRENNDEIMVGIFNIFDVFSPRELETTTALLDSQGIVFYKTIYNDYKDHGKWKDI